MFLHFLELVYFLYLIRSAMTDLTTCDEEVLMVDGYVSAAWTVFLFNWISIYVLFGSVESWYFAAIRIIIVHLSIFMWRDEIWRRIAAKHQFIREQLGRDQFQVAIEMCSYLFDRGCATWDYLQNYSNQYRTKVNVVQTRKNSRRS